MKILFTNSPLNFSHGHSFTQPDWQTLILPYLAGIADNSRKKHDIKLVDNMHGSFLKSNRIEEEILKFQPDILGFSIIASRDIFSTINIIKDVRKKYPDLTLIAGGQSATYYYKWLLESAGIDFVVNKEAEKTFPELIDSLEERVLDYSNIKGISYLKNNESYRTEERGLIKLDDSPFPRWDLMPKLKSKWFNRRYTGSLEMSRGCPFKCNFCAISAYWEKFRQKSNERILEELERLKIDGRTHIYLADDNFAMNPKKYSKLFESMIGKNLDMKFFAQIRTDTIADNPEMVKLAARAGLYGVLVGFDTYDEEIFNDVNKRGSIELNIVASETLRKNKIAIFGCHIYNLPTQKEPEDFEKTWKLGRKYSDLFRMPHFSPLPFTRGYEDLVDINPMKMRYEEVIKNPEYSGNPDFRPRIGNKEQQEKMKEGYEKYMQRHNFSLSEIVGALVHPNKNVRILKRRGYIATARHKLYKVLRKVGLTDI